MIVQSISSVARIWKNGVSSDLAPPPNSLAIVTANSIFAIGLDVYVAGSTISQNGGNSKAILWKNGVPIVLNTGTINSLAYSVFVK